jgi:hypothetical protein
MSNSQLPITARRHVQYRVSSFRVFFGPVTYVRIAIPVQKKLLRLDQEGTRTAGWVENAKWPSVFDKPILAERLSG